MGLNQLCPYTEADRNCAKCMTCHAINPSARAPNRRVCQRTRQWPSCPRYIEAWRIGVTPYRANYVVSMEEQKPAPQVGGIGRVGGAIPSGIPTEANLTPEPPCRFLVYKESGCATCGGYVCSASEDRRIMDTMLEVCMNEPVECAIHQNMSE